MRRTSPAGDWIATIRPPGVTWLSRSPGVQRSIHLPDLPEHVEHAMLAVDDSCQHGACELWVAAVSHAAAHALLYGEAADRIARSIEAAGGAGRIVRCGDELEARRVARILALAGDYVVQGCVAAVIFQRYAIPRPSERW